VRCEHLNLPAFTAGMKHEFTEQIVLRIRPELRQQLERQAQQEDRSLANLTRRLLERAAAASEPVT
jgi:predicted HicB family RNase H-like nuclease